MSSHCTKYCALSLCTLYCAQYCALSLYNVLCPLVVPCTLIVLQTLTVPCTVPSRCVLSTMPYTVPSHCTLYCALSIFILFICPLLFHILHHALWWYVQCPPFTNLCTWSATFVLQHWGPGFGSNVCVWFAFSFSFCEMYCGSLYISKQSS